jgi:hypothetical protein
MAKNQKLEVQGIVISIQERNNKDYISLTDIVSGFEGGSSLIEKWLRNKNTLEFLAIWEKLNNASFNSPEFEGIKSEAGLNRFTISAKQWIEKTGAVGIISSAGRYGGTYAHKDIAFEFCMWISPEFKLLLINEFQRLKEEEAERKNLDWDVKRIVSKINYRIHTGAIKEVLPNLNLAKDKEKWIYAEEADMLNLAVFGITAKQWQQDNPELTLNGDNIRDYADLHELTVISNLESINSLLLKQGLEKKERLQMLHDTALEQLKLLREMKNYSLDKLKSPNLKLIEQKKQKSK